ncbi:MAG: type II secretion system protein [Candidatus Sungbacteria bacterium]|uniref:Type II secretion system protein n=1 Tax=Candidatus Sungiibacteriota bacterium TaxID=2750080 RepID=A0A933DTZ4_9BACT|nr:type II secretion system protein [Candidatus Sungbacteria bacterium]
MRYSHKIRGLASYGGFTLLETIVALALIVSALIGPFTLATRGIFGAKFSKSKIVALNLAQEGIELVRAMRENNVLAGANWRGLFGPCASGCTRLQDGSYQPDVYYAASGATPPINTGAAMLFDAAAGLYSQASGGATPYTRVVSLTTPAADQMQVVSLLTWTESGIARQVRLEETLYNWQ